MKRFELSTLTLARLHTKFDISFLKQLSIFKPYLQFSKHMAFNLPLLSLSQTIFLNLNSQLLFENLIRKNKLLF